MKEDIKISIIIPVYNAEEYLKECLDSVVSQTIEQKEILCVDDGSSDGSFLILQRYQEKHSCIKIFRQENKGAGEARNMGLQYAQGKYVSFLDADDLYMDPRALEEMIYTCENMGVPVCAGLRRYYYKDGTIEDYELYREYFEDGRNPDGVVLCFRDRQDEYFYQNYIYDMSIIREKKICFPPYRRYQDTLFFLRYMVSIEKYVVLPLEFYGYRFSDEAVSRKETYLEDTLKGIRDNAMIAKEYHLDKLKEVLAYRISEEYSAAIIKNANPEIWKLLCEIRTILFSGNTEEKKPKSEKPKSEKPESEKSVSERSVEIVCSFIAGNFNGNSLGAYLKKQGKAGVAVYGLGNFGMMTVEQLKKAQDLKIYGVDRKVKEREGVVIGPLEEINRQCDIIIVTPVKGNREIVAEVKKVWNGSVYGLGEILLKIEKQG